MIHIGKPIFVHNNPDMPMNIANNSEYCDYKWSNLCSIINNNCIKKHIMGTKKQTLYCISIAFHSTKITPFLMYIIGYIIGYCSSYVTIFVVFANIISNNKSVYYCTIYSYYRYRASKLLALQLCQDKLVCTNVLYK